MKRLAMILLVASGAAFAAPPIGTPDQISTAVDSKGAQAFFESLSEDDADKLMDKIGSGQSQWIALAPKLAKGADASNAEGLGIELAYALPKNPTAVLGVVDPVDGDGHSLQVSRVCGIPFIETIPRGYKAKALRAVEKVSDPQLQQIKARCLKALENS
ncbi:hypothetical protein [Paraburkholderia ferrariae]|uniref:hypothetical protein n=1 Tax=Paraburkholderia ferrariae TaxID=386056 RepID=UPI000484B96A|nr:hypothetical protein [Paraburkholderia ferrariae]